MNATDQPHQPDRPTPAVSSARLDADAARELLSSAEQVRRTARADQQGVAIPLLVLGPLTVGAALLQEVWHWVTFHDLGPGESRTASPEELAFSDFVDRYWGTVGAVGLLVIGIWFGWRSRRRGVGSGAGAWIAGAVGVFVLFAYSGLLLMVWPPLTMLTVLAPSVFIVVALLLIAWRRHNGRLALWVVAFGLVTVLASFFVFSNRFYDLLNVLGLPEEVVLGLGGKGDALVQVGLGLVMVLAGVRAMRRAGAVAPSSAAGLAT